MRIAMRTWPMPVDLAEGFVADTRLLDDRSAESLGKSVGN